MKLKLKELRTVSQLLDYIYDTFTSIVIEEDTRLNTAVTELEELKEQDGKMIISNLDDVKKMILKSLMMFMLKDDKISNMSFDDMHEIIEDI